MFNLLAFNIQFGVWNISYGVYKITSVSSLTLLGEEKKEQ